jgi:hypothetical protein
MPGHLAEQSREVVDLNRDGAASHGCVVAGGVCEPDEPIA